MRIPRGYGSKREAVRVLLRAHRAWAKAKRAHATVRTWDARRYTAESNKERTFGELMGTVTALSAVGAWTPQCQRIHDRHFKRINYADVKRGVSDGC